jgi:DNA-binding LytR/AlgR family response regulator
MKHQSSTNTIPSGIYLPESFGNSQIANTTTSTKEVKNLLQGYQLPSLDDLLTKLVAPAGKKSFLVHKNNKYINVLTENIAFFYVKYESSIIVTFDKQEYFVSHSLEQIQNLVTEDQFFRINRQFLINFNAVKEVEHYFARKLLVNLVVPAKEKVIVPKEKVSQFLHWLDNR